MHIAILFDADNASHMLAGKVLNEVGKQGKITIKRAYGDFMRNTSLTPWIDTLREHSIEVKQKFSYSIGKNSTDIAMIIDAMDILHSKAVQGFCLVSSDSDFTHLAQRIRSEGLFCMAIGRYTTPVAFKNACDSFIYTENLQSEPGEKPLDSELFGPKLPGLNIVGKIALPVNETKNKTHPAAPLSITHGTETPLPVNRITQAPISLCKINQAIEMAADTCGTAPLSMVSTALKTIDPGFDPRTYGHKSVSKLFQCLSKYYHLEIDKDGCTLYVKIRS
ncbi:MAG TPA: NYN domain-containing protein [Chitinophagales bacterium]|nr:NYN domain-containing protein [Chitinophagales bacterium]